ncbi:MAG TPA: cysteine hydrolase [Pseudomonas sp.]|uniref:Isochorismatase family protein n=1 Tax=Pseudomonas helleri TaxID=1608996 RepID=A0A0J6I8E8_9PSED|nr:MULTISPECIES: cysteine hydrolase family protein [Pseudomonas]KMN08069.1 isochorismatase [Pseudomonas helleri]MQT57098.1 isochorismatase family protein [Pseudomonas sp. FSL R10-0399]MQU06796.1 isochorismatase family protein [Pseudomonas helleri]MQU65152.1 isochorismatase family protein [Pseudomonas sp. FSL R10-1350]HCN66537.1 cysteine hydrolase [Pseudomonas sp.]
MSALKTMFQLTGRGYAAANLSNASLLIIDAQNEYLSGPLALSGMEAATANIALLLEAARKAKRPVVHVRHLGTVGGMFDPQGPRGEFIAGLEPTGDEVVIEKRMPNAFNDTRLREALETQGHLDLIVCGFMSHSSVSTTVRAAKDYGFRCTLVEDACATRDLPTANGVISAADVQRTEMAIMNDNFATLAQTKNLI